MIARALLGGFLAFRFLRINPLRNIRRLPREVVIDKNGIGVEHIVAIDVTDVANRGPNDRFIIKLGLGRDLTSQDDHVRFDHRLASHAAGAILRQASVEDAIGNKVSHFVGMTFAY